MRILFILISIALPTASFAGNMNKIDRKDVSKTERKLQYKCIEEGRDDTWDELRACVKEKKGSSFITIEKNWDKDSKPIRIEQDNK